MEEELVIYADPPWKYDFSVMNKRAIENHYPTMTLGTGYWFRNQHELLLVGIRGKIKSPFSKRLAVPSVYRQKRTKHSEKPAYFRNLIDKWFPDARKIEVFARTKGKGWETEGNERISSILDWI